MLASFYDRIKGELDAIDADGLTKPEHVIVSPQAPMVTVVSAEGQRRELLNLCANNYLGLADHPEIIAAAQLTLNSHGFGAASVRFICGTFDLHRRLEKSIAEYVGTEDAITFAACFDANGGVFEPLFGPDDAIVSDSLNHASIIDGIRLCKAKRYRFANQDMDALEDQLKQARADGAREILIVSDGVFSMDGYIADLKGIRALADKYQAMIMVDDCHATGFVGPGGRGSHAHHDLIGQIDILTGTFGKALGGGMGGYIAASQPIIDLLRQRARPYLFSNALAPMLAAGALKAIELARAADDRRDKLARNARRFRAAMTLNGFDLLPGQHPIVPVMIGDAAKAADLAKALMQEGVFATAFSYPVVPKGQARIRTQMCAAHTSAQVEQAVGVFIHAAEQVGGIL